MVRTKTPSNFKQKKGKKIAVKSKATVILPTEPIAKGKKPKQGVRSVIFDTPRHPRTAKARHALVKTSERITSARRQPETSTPRVTRSGRNQKIIDVSMSSIVSSVASIDASENDDLAEEDDEINFSEIPNPVDELEPIRGTTTELTALQKYNQLHHEYPFDFEVNKPMDDKTRQRIRRWKRKNLPENAEKYQESLNKQTARDMLPHRIYGRRKSQWSLTKHGVEVKTKTNSHSDVVGRNNRKVWNSRTRKRAHEINDPELLKAASYVVSQRKYQAELDDDQGPSTSSDNRTMKGLNRRRKRARQQTRDIEKLTRELNTLKSAVALTNPAYAAQVTAEEAATVSRMDRIASTVDSVVDQSRPDQSLEIRNMPPVNTAYQSNDPLLYGAEIYYCPSSNRYFANVPLQSNTGDLPSFMTGEQLPVIGDDVVLAGNLDISQDESVPSNDGLIESAVEFDENINSSFLSSRTNVSRNTFKTTVTNSTDCFVRACGATPSKLTNKQHKHIRSLKSAQDKCKRYAGKRMMKRTYAKLCADYRIEFPFSKIGLTRFSQSRPSDVLYPTTRDRRSCLCSYCTNAELDFKAMKRHKLTDEPNVDVFAMSLICPEPSDECYNGSCSTCKDKPDPEILAAKLPTEGADVCFSRWQLEKKDGFSHVQLVQQRKPVIEYCQLVRKWFRKYLSHLNNVVKQYRAIKSLKEKSPPGTMIIQLDFSQKYNPITNSEVQSAFFGKQGISLLPIHARITRLDGSVTLFSIVMVSDSMKQTHDEVKAYLNQFFQIIRTTQKHWFEEVNKVVYLSDGAASQFKSKSNLWNLCYHEQDYNLKAEWHFFATSHGKGPCDAIGAIFKRTADQLTNFDQVKNISTEKFALMVAEELNKTRIHYVSMEYINEVRLTNLERQKTMVLSTPPRFKLLKSHYFEPSYNSIGTLNASFHSCSCDICITSPIGEHCDLFTEQLRSISFVAHGDKGAVAVNKRDRQVTSTVNTETISVEVEAVGTKEMGPYKVGDFVAALYDNDWYLAQISSIESKGEYFVQFMKRTGCNLFRYCTPSEQKNEQCSISEDDILRSVAPPFPSSNTRIEILKLAKSDYDNVCKEYHEMLLGLQ